MERRSGTSLAFAIVPVRVLAVSSPVTVTAKEQAMDMSNHDIPIFIRSVSVADLNYFMLLVEPQCAKEVGNLGKKTETFPFILIS